MGNKFVFHADHDALKYMIHKPQLRERITRWVLLLKKFNFIVEVRPRKSHANADQISRLNEFGSRHIDDLFLDVQLFLS